MKFKIQHFLFFYFLFFLSSVVANAQSYLVIIDESLENKEQVYSNQKSLKNVKILDGKNLSAPQQIVNSLKNDVIDDLHIYAPTKQGAIVFNSVSITTETVEYYAQQFLELESLVKNKVIVHSEVVFEGDEGAKLKLMLQKISGVEFISQK